MKFVQSCVAKVIQLLPGNVSITVRVRRLWAWLLDDWLISIGRCRRDLLKRSASTAYLAAPTSRMLCRNIRSS